MSKNAHVTAIKSFNLNHTSYDQFRPNFNPTIVDKFLTDLNLFDQKPRTDKTILELAAGTGKFTRNLANHGWKDNLIVVEPSEGMLKSFRANFPDIKAFNSSSYSIPLDDNSVDAIVIAQGFHWFSDLESLKEIKRVLKPSGRFGCIWNFDGASKSQEMVSPKPNMSYLFDSGLDTEITETTDSMELSKSMFGKYVWNQKVTDYFYSFDVGVPQYRRGVWKQLLSDNNLFKPIQYENYFYYDLPIPRDYVFEYWLTRSYITDLPDEKKMEIKNKINELLDEYVSGEMDGDLHRIMGTHTVVTEPV